MQRELAALYPYEPRIGDEDYIFIDTAREFRVVGERYSEWGFSVDDEGIYSFTTKQIYHDLSVVWTSNTVLPCEVHVALFGSHAHSPYDWRHPQWQEWTVPPGFVVDTDSPIFSASWNEGRNWITAGARNGLNDLRVKGLVAWMQFTPHEIMDSKRNPPGTVGLVPFHRFEQISVEEALAWRPRSP
ncbi:hypothetical protein BH10ACT7_BH10ACT7_25300 [soil metagenome]